MSLPPLLPEHIRRRAVQPPGLPVGDSAWSKDDALALLATLDASPVAVLHVDSYVLLPYGQGEVIHTGRQATYSYGLGERTLQFAQRSRESASEFIRVGESDELFVLLFSNQDDAEAGYGSVVRTA